MGGSAVLGQEPVSQWEGCVGPVQGRGQLWGPSPERKFSPTVPFALREVGGKNKVCQCGWRGGGGCGIEEKAACARVGGPTPGEGGAGWRLRPTRGERPSTSTTPPAEGRTTDITHD